MLDSTPVSCNSLGKYFCLNGKQLEEQYILHLSDFVDWDQRKHAEDWVLHQDNVGKRLSIDETSLSQGELYTVVTNKAAKSRKGALVAIIKGTDSDTVSAVLMKIGQRLRNKVEEVTLDMAASMQKIVRSCFPKASQVTDRFHVQHLAFDAVQDIRIKHRWDAIDQDNQEMDLCKENNKTYIPNILENGDTPRQLLARSRYLLFKSESKWTPKQRMRAEVLFKYYPDLEQAYMLSQKLSWIYHASSSKEIAMTRLAHWYKDVEEAGFRSFNTVIRTIHHNYQTILNYFDNRSTNASAEGFNAKIKAFRSQFRGVRNIPFFLFRLSKIYA